MNWLLIFYVSGGGAINSIQRHVEIPDLTNVKSNSDMTIVSCCDPDVRDLVDDDTIASGFTVGATGLLVAVV